MKTKAITFYSYKGGVGRTLLLANMAKQLSDMGKSVCILDFDLEAPGIEYKLQNDSFFIDPPQETRGIVDYVYDFYKTGNKQDFINPTSAITFKKNARNITIFRAGDYKDSSYWSKLSQINWADLFYKENSNGIPFLVELKQTIIERFKPDYILIDSRTGITEIASLTMSISPYHLYTSHGTITEALPHSGESLKPKPLSSKKANSGVISGTRPSAVCAFIISCTNFLYR